MVVRKCKCWPLLNIFELSVWSLTFCFNTHSTNIQLHFEFMCKFRLVASALFALRKGNIFFGQQTCGDCCMGSEGFVRNKRWQQHCGIMLTFGVSLEWNSETFFKEKNIFIFRFCKYIKSLLQWTVRTYTPYIYKYFSPSFPYTHSSTYLSIMSFRRTNWKLFNCTVNHKP